MSHGKSDEEVIKNTHNTARYFVETRHISWVLLIATCLWGVFGYFSMPQRKDPDIPVRVAVALTPWPGASAEKIENLITRKLESRIAENSKVIKIESISRTSISVVYLELDEKIKDSGKELDDIKLKLDGIDDLPDGSGPINFIKDFGDTAALMLTVASPKVSDVEIALRAKAVRKAIETTRAQARSGDEPRFTIVLNYPQSINARLVRNGLDRFARFTKEVGYAQDIRLVEGGGFVGLDGASGENDEKVLGYLQQFLQERAQAAELDPAVWQPIIIRDPNQTTAKMQAAAGDKYSYREMEDFTDTIEKTIKTIPLVSKVTRSGILDEKIYLEYSQERLASYGIQSGTLQDILKARNIRCPEARYRSRERISPSTHRASSKTSAKSAIWR